VRIGASEATRWISLDDDRAAAELDDLYSHVELQKKLQTPICLESASFAGASGAAIALGACKIINIKMGRVGGYTWEADSDLVPSQGRSGVVRRMLEAGIGRAHNIALSTLPNFILPGM